MSPQELAPTQHYSFSGQTEAYRISPLDANSAFFV